jgi:NAD(P)H-flavin reductase
MIVRRIGILRRRRVYKYLSSHDDNNRVITTSLKSRKEGRKSKYFARLLYRKLVILRGI